MNSPFNILKKLFVKPITVPPESIAKPESFSTEDLASLKMIGITKDSLWESMHQALQINFERTVLYRELDRCLRRGTKVRLCNGENVPIEKIVNNSKYIGEFIWSINQSTLQIEPDRIVAAKLTKKNASLVRIHLDNNEFVDCTSNHPFMLRDGLFKQAKDLVENDSLMPFYSKISTSGLSGYEMIFNPRIGKYSYAHRITFVPKQVKGYVIHHKDLNKLNNSPINLERITSLEHRKIHGQHRIGKPGYNLGKTKETDEGIRRISEKAKGRKLVERVKIGYKHARNRMVVNHKVVCVRRLVERDDVYDLTTEKNHNFSLSSGIFVHNCILHPIVGAAAELYADYVSVYNRINSGTVWITSDSTEYKDNLTKFLDFIGIEEKIFDWAWTCGTFGDLFVKPDGEPGKGIISVDDNDHPANISRVDYRGLLVGFYRTPFEAGGMEVSQGSSNLLPPWEFVHMRTLGSKRKRPAYSDPTFSEYRTVHLMGPETRQVTSKYGTSLLINSIPIYKRLRLAEDTLLLARMTRGILKYAYLINVKGMNPDAAREIVDQYMNILKRARAVDTNEVSASFDSKCLRGSTKIRLCNGPSLPIEDIVAQKEFFVGRYVWSINQSTLQIEPVRIVDVKKTRLNASLVRVHLDNDKYVDCTSDHPFMLRDGSFKQAKYLIENDSLMPFYSKIANKGDLVGYELVYNPAKKGYVFAHRVTFNPKQRKGFVIHHRDFNKLNNSPDNLELVTNKEHKERRDVCLTPELIQKRIENRQFYSLASNHKVVCVRRLVERDDTYDIEVEKNHNFAIEAGIFLKNSNPLGVVEDLFIPVFGDEQNSIRIEKLGGEVDIKWIVDIEELRNQLATALRCPLTLLGGYVKEGVGPLGNEAFEKLDIRFARASRRLQRALIEGITRLCQIHLAYQNMDPDPKLFQVHMSETSTAEEEQIRDAMDKSMDAISKFIEITDKLGVSFDKIELLNYFNNKILKLGDLDIRKFVKGTVEGQTPDMPPALESKAALLREAIEDAAAEQRKKVQANSIGSTEYLAPLPLGAHTTHKFYEPGSVWEAKYSGVKIEVKRGKL